MKTLGTTLLVLGSLLGPRLPAFSQAAPDLTAAVATAQEQYAASFVGHPQLYNGPEYVDYTRRYRTRTGHQFFLTPEMQPGRVNYNNHTFEGLRLAYDVVRDQVVLPQPTSPQTLRLINEKVRFFSINDHRFVRLVADSAAGDVIRTGYYEVLADGRTQVLARRAKKLQEHVIQGGIDVDFTPSDKLFIKKAGTYYAVSRKGAVLRLFADQGKEMRKYAQEQKLKFGRSDFEASTVSLARYYEGLKPQ